MSSKIAILVAIIIGVIAIIFINTYLTQHKSADDTRKTTILRAAKDFPAGTKMGYSHVIKVQIPTRDLSSNIHITPGNFTNAIKGRQSNKAYRKGQTLSLDDFREDGSYERLVPDKGCSLTAVQMHPGESELFSEGDIVDLVIYITLDTKVPSFRPKRDTGEESESEELEEDIAKYGPGLKAFLLKSYQITVLRQAIIKRVPDAQSRRPGARGKYGSIIVQLTNAQIAVLNKAKNVAQIYLQPRNPQDSVEADIIEVEITTSSFQKAIELLEDRMKTKTPLR